MKRFLTMVLTLAMTLTLVACGSGNTDAEEVESEQATEENEEIDVDEGLLTVDITVPLSFYEEKTPDEIKADAEANGFINCVITEDEMVVYTMSKATHKKMMKEFQDSIEECVDDMLNGEDAVESFQKIQYNETVSVVDIYVDAGKYTSWDSFAALSFYFTGSFYQAFSGVDADDIDVVVNIIDYETEKLIDSMSLSEMGEA